MSENLDRRTFLRALGACALAPAAGSVSCATAPRFTADPFTLGVASGSPLPDGVVLWTRLAPDPLADGGLDPIAIPVRWEVAMDESFRKIARRGNAVAEPAFGHSVHVEVDGLEPDRWYFYRFLVGDAVSPVGRTRTAPPPDALGRWRFAFASCQQYEQGFYAAHRHMAAEELDLVVFLGDYTYESSWGKKHVRKHEGPEPYTLAQYRNRYARYKTDPDLQRCHASFPWIVTWDDHEVDNDYANDRSEDLDPDFLVRRAAAYQAFYEHMPLRAASRPQGPSMRIYGRHDFGRLARFYVLDDRQYRTHQACPRPGRGGSNRVDECDERLDEDRTMLGFEQEAWLGQRLADSGARWNVIAQQTLMAQVDRAPGPEKGYWTDGWDGYPAARRRLLTEIAKRKVANPLVIGGDVHAYWVCDLVTDFDDSNSPVVATEICGTSISSQGASQKRIESWRAEAPHAKYARSDRRGYTTVELNGRQARVRLRAIDSEKDANSKIRTIATFLVADGKAGAERD
ncbi:MAG: alkaline phosphatase D family protein [Pseudomonadota bacterium]|nr:MAG: alkaline phosphatase D family protein [Pseudomonadota bacterium]